MRAWWKSDRMAQRSRTLIIDRFYTAKYARVYVLLSLFSRSIPRATLCVLRSVSDPAGNRIDQATCGAGVAHLPGILPVSRQLVLQGLIFQRSAHDYADALQNHSAVNQKRIRAAARSELRTPLRCAVAHDCIAAPADDSLPRYCFYADREEYLVIDRHAPGVRGLTDYRRASRSSQPVRSARDQHTPFIQSGDQDGQQGQPERDRGTIQLSQPLGRNQALAVAQFHGRITRVQPDCVGASD